ncbi:MAG: SDR family oxidoreductase [Rhizobiaceae bacterium]|nr:SDR family oxidoreductase [Rhizobiaceae bacterium]
MSNKVILVTGGSRGIGAAICRHAADLGYDVAFTYKSSDAAAQKVAGEIEAKGKKALAIKADAAVDDDTIRAFKELEETFGRLDALVYNAGITGARSRLDESSTENFTQVMMVNTVAAMTYSREAIKRMSTKHGGAGGSIVMISSTAYESGSPGSVWYAASKGGINAMTIGLSRELGQDGIRVNAVAPGPINTGITSPQQTKIFVESTSLKRMAEPQEVATVVMFLCSEGASFTTGAVVKVAGGR